MELITCGIWSVLSESIGWRAAWLQQLQRDWRATDRVNLSIGGVPIRRNTSTRESGLIGGRTCEF